MPLERLSPEHENLFLPMIEDYMENHPDALLHFFGGLKDARPATFRSYVQKSEKEVREWRPKAKQVSITRYVWIDPPGTISGNGLLRFPLTDATELEGGNLEYNIPPQHRRSDAAALTLNGLLFEAVRAGLARALVTCRGDDLGAIQAILRNRGVLWDSHIPTAGPNKGSKINRYWINFR